MLKTIDYKRIRNNLEGLDKNTILVLKDNAYGCGIKEVLDISYELGFRFYAVIKPIEALFICDAYNDTKVLLLGKEKIKHKNILITVEDYDDFAYAVREGIPYHFKIKSSMNRFGMYLSKEMISDHLCKGIYMHLGRKMKKNIEDVKYVLNQINQLSLNDKLFHIGGTMMLNYFPEITKRVGMAIYTGAITLKGKIIKIRKLDRNDVIGYQSSFKAYQKCLVGIIDIGYSSGLLKSNKGKSVLINNQRYKLIGIKCMDYSFVLIDNKVRLYDEVIFDNLEKFEKKSKYELYLNLK